MFTCYVLSFQKNISDHKIYTQNDFFKPQFSTFMLEFHKAFFNNICNLEPINKEILKLYLVYTKGSQMVKRFVTVR